MLVIQADIDDVELMAAVAGGRMGALEDLYDRYGGFAYALAYRLVGDRESAEEVVQESFLTVWRYAGRYDAKSSPVRPWLIRMVRQRSIDHLRGRAARPLVGTGYWEDQVSASDVWHDVAQNLLQEQVGYALLCLPAEQRVAIELAYFSGFTHAEIAQRLDLPLGTVKGRMRLGLRKLQSLLDPALL